MSGPDSGRLWSPRDMPRRMDLETGPGESAPRRKPLKRAVRPYFMTFAGRGVISGPCSIDPARPRLRCRTPSKGPPQERSRAMTEIATFQTPTYTHAHHLSLKSLTWVTLGITAVMGGLFFAVGFPPAFDTFYEKMYFHSIGIGIAAMLAYLMLETFRLEDYEPPIDFPIRYRAFLAVVFGAIGGLFALSPSIWTGWPDVGMLFFVAAFVLVADVGGAMLVELIVLPRKKAGVYHGDSRNIIDYVWRLVPLTAADRAPYRGLSSAYWLAVISLASACVAALIGFINLWVRAFGPSIFGGFYGLFGYNQQGILDATLDPHSHMIALAIFGGIVAVAVLRFRALESDSRVRSEE